ncbi:unnamed protein product [Notodromas monacha]|uniref:RNA methyltransferase n=1 Tax=Notodromas monacha TaxID=399045 RepID=A0A7R9BXW1_9CRUS|nr:unnamed protein product [Notodromas monacha]CAG0922426.1 unnamed protein product [Notodromas monacha]
MVNVGSAELLPEIGTENDIVGGDELKTALDANCNHSLDRGVAEDGKQMLKLDSIGSQNVDVFSERRTRNRHSNEEQFSAKPKQIFRYGNYNQYYGKRNPNGEDVRLDHLPRAWFENKSCLDIGCNIGHITYSIARDFCPRRIVGIDIDPSLVHIARKNLPHYFSSGENTSEDGPMAQKRAKKSDLAKDLRLDGKFRGAAKMRHDFPYNIGFVAGNYVGDDDTVVDTSKPEYDVILCLSVTKWVHLNFGDAGIMRLFKRVFNQLRPGGVFVMEPQTWKTYAKSYKICEELRRTYQEIKIRPVDFPKILILEVGFERMQELSEGDGSKSGFSRSVQAYFKKDS